MHNKQFCEQCGVELTIDKHESKRKGRKKYCSSVCAQKATYHRKSKLRAIMLDTYPCVCMVPKCGYKKVVDAHHIVPKSQQGKDELDNGILLCPNHHREADAGLISKETLVEWVSMAKKTRNNN